MEVISILFHGELLAAFLILIGEIIELARSRSSWTIKECIELEDSMFNQSIIQGDCIARCYITDRRAAVIELDMSKLDCPIGQRIIGQIG